MAFEGFSGHSTDETLVEDAKEKVFRFPARKAFSLRGSSIIA
jgi:hypothetical protein